MADLELIAAVTSAYLRKNSVGIDRIGDVVRAVTDSLNGVNGVLLTGVGDTASPAVVEKPEPAVSVKKSVQHDFLICLECGVQAKTLKRHLGSSHQLTPQAYRERWDLPRDYPLTAPAYSERRSKMAKSLGLGRKAGAKTRGGRRKTS
jgi:predicted transcriptional regulator